MAELSRSELDLLIRGAGAIAEMRELNIPQEEIQGILQAGAQRFGDTVSRGKIDGSFRFNKPFKKGETQLRSVAERTRGTGSRPAGTPRDRPEITSQYISAVLNKLRDADVGLKEAMTVSDDFGQRTIDQGSKSLAGVEDRVLEGIGFQNYEELAGRDLMPGDRNYEPADPQREQRDALRRDRYYQRQLKQLDKQPRFENPVDMGYGGAEGEGFSSRVEQSGIDRRSAADTLQKLQGALAAGAVPSNAQTDRLVRELGLMADPRLEMQAQREAGRQTVLDNPINQEAAARNQADMLSAVEAERGRRRQGIFPGGRRGNDEAALANLARIDLTSPDIVRNTSLVNNQGLPDYVEMDTAIAGSNTPDTNNNLNAPNPQSATEFVTQQIDATGSAGMFEGRAIGDVDISGALARADQAIADLAGREIKVTKGKVKRNVTPFSEEMVRDIGPIRSIDALQQASNAILAVGQEAGVNFPQMIYTEGKMKAQQVANPGVGEVLQFLKMNAGEQQRLGIALNNVDLAGNNLNPGSITPINAESKRRFAQGEAGTPRPDVIFGVKNLPGRSKGLEMEVDLARMPSDKAKRVKRKMRGPEGVGPASEDARMPFIGAVAGEEAPASYIRGVPANPGYEDVGVSAIDDEVRGRVYAGGPSERAVRDAAIRRIVDRGSQEQARRDQIAEGMMRMDRRPGRMF